MGNTLEELLESANRTRVVDYNRVNGETITFQIGRVVYSMSRQRAGVFLRDALKRYHRSAWAGEEEGPNAERPDTVHKVLASGSIYLKT